MSLGLAILVVAVCAAGAVAMVASAGQTQNQLDEARNATAAFQNFDNLPAEFGELKDTAGIACIDMPRCRACPLRRWASTT